MKRLCMILAVWLLVTPILAQDETIVSVGSLEIELPDGWYTDSEYQSFYSMPESMESVLVLHETGLEALLVSPEKVDELIPDAANQSYQEILVELANISYDLEIADQEFFTIDLGAVDGLRWFYEDTESIEDVIQGDLYLIPLTEGGYLFADIYTYQSYFEDDVDALEAAMEELFISAGAVLLEDGGGSDSPDTSETEISDGWSVVEDDYQPYYLMNEDLTPFVLIHETGLEALIIDPKQVEGLVPNAENMSYEELLIEFGSLAYELDLTEQQDSFFSVDLGAIDGIRWFYDDNEAEDPIRGDLYVIPLTEGGYMFADIYAFQENFIENTDAMEAAIEALFIELGAVVLGD